MLERQATVQMPEQKLFFEIIKQAVSDLRFALKKKPDAHESRYLRTARNYLVSTYFNGDCSFVGLTPDYVRLVARQVFGDNAMRSN